MPEEFTLFELHVHSDDNEFRNDFQLSSDLGSFLKDRFGGSLGADGGETIGFGSDEEELEADDEANADQEDDEDDDGGFSLSLGSEEDESEEDESEEDESDDENSGIEGPSDDPAVVEIDTEVETIEEEDLEEESEEADADEDEESGGLLRTLLFVALVAIVIVFARRYFGGDDFEEFEEFDDDFEDL